MTSITRPGGPTGPTGPDGPDGPDRPDGPGAGSELTQASSTPASTTTDPIADLAAAVDRGAVTPRDAMQQLIEDSVAGLPADQADELRAAMAELLAEDPYLRGLASELGVPADPGDGA